MASISEYQTKVEFLSQEEKALKSLKGQGLYEELMRYGCSYDEYFKSIGTSLDRYLGNEYGIDMQRVTVDNFFQTDPNLKWLFPEIVRSGVDEGIKYQAKYHELIASDISIEGGSYTVPYVNEDGEMAEAKDVLEGASIPETKLSYGSRIVSVGKKGRGLIASYEAIRRMSINMLRVHLRRLGQKLGAQLDEKVADILQNGDQADGSNAATLIPATGWTFSDLVKGFLALSVDNGFNPSHMIVSKTVAEVLLNLSELKEIGSGEFMNSGKLPAPLGIKIIVESSQNDNYITVLDNGYAVAKLTERSIEVESDKLISAQWDRTYVTTVTDFAILYDKARIVLDAE